MVSPRTRQNKAMHSDRRTYVVTGADSGLGRMVASRLAADGQVITCGLGDEVDVRADLSTMTGRTMLIEQVRRLSGGRVDGLIAAAGAGAPSAQTVALNYFGTVAVVEGLHKCLAAAEAPAVVVVSSSSTLNRGSGALVRSCGRGDEPGALAIARRLLRTKRGSQIYRSTKMALNLWVRRAAVTARWVDAGIVVNAVAPGVVATELVLQAWPREGVLMQTALPQPLGSPGPVEPVADLLCYLASPANRFMTGQVIYCDGGTDALTRGVRPQQVFLRYGLKEIATMWREARRLTGE